MKSASVPSLSRTFPPPDVALSRVAVTIPVRPSLQRTVMVMVGELLNTSYDPAHVNLPFVTENEAARKADIVFAAKNQAVLADHGDGKGRRAAGEVGRHNDNRHPGTSKLSGRPCARHPPLCSDRGTHHFTAEDFVQYIEVRTLNACARFGHGPARGVCLESAPSPT